MRRLAIAACLVLASCGPDGDAMPAATVPAASSTLPTTTTIPVATTATDAPTTTLDLAPRAGRPEVSLQLVTQVGALTDALIDPTGTRLLVVEQSGRILDVTDDQAATLLDITDRTTADGERGALGATFSRDGQWLIVNYTSNRDADTGDTVVGAFPVRADGTIDPDEERVLLTIDQPYANHNGGDLITLDDGTVLVSTGDGGSGGDPDRVAHRLDSPLGKILRIDGPDVTGMADDNPFVGSDDVRADIWSSGLRNPWRIDIDPFTGDLWVADVGQNEFEEISVARAGDDRVGGAAIDFGWSSIEGTTPFNGDVSPDPRTKVIEPVHVYTHGADGCSISGGMLYRGKAIESLWGWYVVADFCVGEIRALNPTTGDVVALGNVEQPTAVVRGIGGEPVIVSATGRVVSVGPP